MLVKSTRTIQSASALSEHLDTRSAVRDVVEQLQSRRVARPEILFVFGSFHHRALFREGIDALREALHPQHLLATTVETVVHDAREIERTAGLSVLALTLPGVVARPFWFDLEDGPPAVWSEGLIRERVALPPDEGSGHGVLPHRAIIMLADPFSIHPGQACAAIDAAAGPTGARIMGGVASGASHPGLHVLATDRRLSHSGVVGLSIFGDVEIDGVVSQGCKPLGAPLVITKARGNEIIEIGGKSAVAAVQEIVEQLPIAVRDALGQGLLVGIAPDAAKPRLGHGDFLVRTVLAVDRDSGSVSVSDQVRPGMTVQFKLRDGASAHQDLGLLLDAEQLRSPASAALLFTCNGRGTRLFDAPNHDAEYVSRRLGNPPLAGFQCAGEIGMIGQCSFVHTQSASLVIFREPHRRET